MVPFFLSSLDLLDDDFDYGHFAFYNFARRKVFEFY